jgi:uncharacterized protein Yka (UPF0111/DUF47 family)
MKAMMEEFHNFRKSATIHSLIIEINHIEEEADRLYTEAVRTLYVTSADPVEIIDLDGDVQSALKSAATSART